MNQAVEARLEFDESAEIGDARHRAFDSVAGVIFVGGRGPGVGLQLLQTERNSFFGGIDFENLDVELLADREHIGRLIDAPVRDIGDVQHAVHAADVDECAVIEQTAHRAVHHHAGLQATQLLFLRLRALFFEHHAAIDDDVFLLGIELDDAAGNLLADQRLHLGNVARAAAGSGHEGAHADIDRKPALDDGGHEPGNGELFVERLLQTGPVFGPLDFDQRKLVIALLVAALDADLNHVAGLDRDGAFFVAQRRDGHDAFGLLADIEEHVLVVDRDDGGFAALFPGAFVRVGLFELVEDVAERALRLRRILPFLFANVFLAKRRNRVGHGGDYVSYCGTRFRGVIS